MIADQHGSAVVIPKAVVPWQRQTLDKIFTGLFFVSLGGLGSALWAKGDVADLYSAPVVFILLLQGGVAFASRLRVQVRAGVFALASSMSVVLALPALGSGLPVVLVSVVTSVGIVVLLARQLELLVERREVLPGSQQPALSALPSSASHSETTVSHRAPRAGELQTLGLLAATLTHDFNNLLSVVLANTSSLKAQLPSNVDEVDEIEQVAHEAADLCKRVLRMSREPAAPLEDSNLNLLVQAELPLLRRLASARVRVVWEPGPDVYFLASRTEFRQLLLNLCANARDAMPNGGELRLMTSSSARPVMATDETEAFVCLRVSDTGVGMDQATQDRMFDPFFTTKAPSKGTGLGMAVVAASVERHKAHLEVHSQPHVGTTISIFFPEVAAVEAPESVPGESMTRELGGKETILVVDDDPRVLRAISRTLRRYGYRVIGAADGLEGMAALALQRVDLVICDAVMPNMDGPMLFREVTKTDQRLPFLFCSGASEEEMRLEEAADHVPRLHKPFTEEALLLKVRDLLAKPESSKVEGPKLQDAC